MTRESKLAVRIVVVAALCAATTAFADPLSLFRQPARPQRPPRVETPGFTSAGIYGGMIGDQLLVDGTSYTLRAKTQPYLVGRGPISVQEIPIGAHVFVTVVGNGQGSAIWGIVVRPADEDRPGAGAMLKPASVRSADAPR